LESFRKEKLVLNRYLEVVMNHRTNIREFNRLANIILKDLSDLPEDQLKDLITISHKTYLHSEFENSYRMSLKKVEEPVVLTS